MKYKFGIKYKLIKNIFNLTNYYALNLLINSMTLKNNNYMFSNRKKEKNNFYC